jgi:hypothetical protein
MKGSIIIAFALAAYRIVRAAREGRALANAHLCHTLIPALQLTMAASNTIVIYAAN